MGTAANVVVGAPGIAYFAPSGTTLPTTADEALDDAFEDLGLVSEDGLVESHDQTTSPIKDWSGQTVREDLTEQTDRYAVTFLETNPGVLETYYGPQDDPDTVVHVKKQKGRRGCWVFDILDGDNTIRKVVPDGQVLTVENITHKVGEAVAYGVNVTCYPDDDGETIHIYPIVGVTGS